MEAIFSVLHERSADSQTVRGGGTLLHCNETPWLRSCMGPCKTLGETIKGTCETDGRTTDGLTDKVKYNCFVWFICDIKWRRINQTKRAYVTLARGLEYRTCKRTPRYQNWSMMYERTDRQCQVIKFEPSNVLLLWEEEWNTTVNVSGSLDPPPPPPRWQVTFPVGVSMHGFRGGARGAHPL